MLKDTIPEGMRILDLGCGTGDFLHELRPAYGVGVDINPDIVRVASSRYPDLLFFVGDIAHLQISCEQFDYILISNVIGYVDDVHELFSEVGRYVGVDTKVVIIYYNYLWEPLLKIADQFGLKMKECNMNWLSLNDIDNLLYMKSFEVIRKTQKILIPQKIPFISVVFNRFIANLPLLWRLSLVQMIVARPIFCVAEDIRVTCSIIVPARNEKGNIEEIVRRLPCMGSHTELIFVEGHSTDGTLDEIFRVREAFPEVDIKTLVQDGDGKADAVRKGFESASGDILMILDADLSVNPEDLPKFYEAIVSGKGELVMGCRLVYQLPGEAMRFLNLLGNKFFSMFFSYLLGQRIKDTLCGTKVIRRTHYRLICENRRYFGDFDPFGDFDLIFGAAKANLKIIEIPVRYQARRYGKTQIRRFYHGFMLLKMVFVAAKKLKFVS